MFRLIGCSKYWVLLCFLLFSVASCNAEHTDVICSHDDVLNCLDDATAYITGKRKKIDDQGDVIGEESCQKDFAKASQQLNHIKTKVQKTYTGHQMTRHQRNQLSNALTMIKESIEAIPSGPEQTKLTQLCNELIAYISSSLRGTAQDNRSL